MSLIKKILKDKIKAVEDGNYKEAALACNAIGNEYLEQEKYEDALQCHIDELEYCLLAKENAQSVTIDGKFIEYDLNIAVANRKIGECYASLNKFSKALQHIKKFYDISRDIGSYIEQQRAWATFGRTYYMKYQYELESGIGDDDSRLITLDQAELNYCKALKLLELPSINSEVTETELAEMNCRLLLNLGLVSEIRGNSEVSSKYVEKGMKIAIDYNLYEDIHRCGYSLGNIYQKLGKNTEADEILNKALSATKKLHNKRLLCEILLSKGINLICLEKYKEAEKCLKSAYKLRNANSEDFEKVIRALKVCKGINDYETKLKNCRDLHKRKIMLEKIADGLSSINCFVLAIKKYHMTLDCMNKADSPLSEKAPIFYSLAETYLDNGNIPDALKYFEKEYKCHEEKPLEQIRTLWKMAEVCENEKHFEKSEKFYVKAVSLAKTEGNQKYIYNSLRKLLTIYKKLNKTNLAKEVKKEIDNINIADECLSDEESIIEEPFNDISVSDLSDSDNNEEEITARKRSRKIELKVNEKGETPLHEACIKGNLSLVKRLVENNHSVNVRDYAGWTPLHEACNYGFYDIVEYLLENGADINDPGGPECKGITALHDAASCGNLDVIQLLLSKGANVTILDENKETALDTLLQWKKTNLRDLDDVTLKQCEAVENELKSKMTKAGMSICQNVADISHSPDIQCQNAVSRGKRNRSFSSSSDSDSDNNDDDEGIVTSPTPPYLNVNDNQIWNDPKAEYKSVMENLRHSATNVKSCVVSQKPKTSGPPLVNENEIITDGNWLVRDTGVIPKTKRKKRRMNKLNLRTSKCIDNYLIHQDSSEEKGLVSISDDSNSSVTNVNFVDRNEKHNQEQQSSDQKCESLAVAFRLRVNVAGKLILVPVPDDTRTIDWLKEEAALRFQAIDGSKPHLTLTKDGALLSGFDLIKSIFTNNEEVLSSIEMWEEPSLDDKYVQLCNRHNTTMSSDIKKRFCDLATSFEMNLSNCLIPYTHLSIVFHTLLNYKCLKHLNLSGTPLSIENISEFVKCIPNLSTLITLNLSCCSLTSKKIKIFLDYLNDQISKTTVLSSLKIVDLSYNFFSPCPNFKAFLKLSSLLSLSLSSCSLDSTFLSSNLLKTLEEKKNLEEIDISDNIFSDDEISIFIHHLPKANIKKLNFRCVIEKEVELGFKLQSFFIETLPYLKEVYLQGCFLKDSDLKLISTSLTCCPQLQIIDLSANPLLSNSCIANFINNLHESSLNISDLNITGTCIWGSNHLSSLMTCLKFKDLKRLCFDNCPETETEKMMQAWSKKWGDKALCSNSFFFCELSIQ